MNQTAFILIILLAQNFFAQVDTSYSVGTWHGFRTSAVSFTFDDGTPKQFSIAVPMFDEYNYKLTMFTVINWSSSNWDALRDAAAHGHEIASHTMTHPHLGAMTDEQQTIELKNSQDQINAHVPGMQCITVAYPYCESGNDSICKKYYIAARGCSGSIEPRTPSNFMNISSFICGELGSIKTTQNFKSKLNSAASSKGWIVFLIHGIDDDGGYSPLVSDTLRAALDYIQSNPDKFWVSSFCSTARYIRERNSLSVTELSADDSVYTCEISDTLDNLIYNVPVTLRRELPADWVSVSVSQNDSLLSSEIIEIDSVKYITFDAVPDGGDILIKKNNTTGINIKNMNAPVSPQLMQNYPNPFNPVTKIKYSVPSPDNSSSSGQMLSLKVFNILGSEVATLVNEEKAPGTYEVTFNGARFSSGVYFYRLTAGNFMETKKMVLLF